MGGFCVICVSLAPLTYYNHPPLPSCSSQVMEKCSFTEEQSIPYPGFVFGSHSVQLSLGYAEKRLRLLPVI